ncbi:MAG: sigma-70 family RNA polymerase sigma factor [Clostridiales bacterium]|nr:sigma-70 family RNA polymerase sigma factor [Clostridiales bacterium]
MEDHEIINLYWKRDEAAIQETSYKYGRFCYSIAMNILSVLEDAEECVSDAYHKAWNAIPPEKPIAFRTWLGRIVRNLSINRWHYNRAQKRYAGAEILLSELSDCIPDTKTTEEIIESQMLSKYISDWLDTLSDTERLLFIRRYWNGEKLKQLAIIAGTNPNELAGRMFRLRKSLSTYLTEKGVAI